MNKKIENRWLSFLAFLMGGGTLINVSLVGQLTVSEAIGLIALPFTLLKRNYYNRSFYIVVCFLIIWFTGALLADSYNNSTLPNIARGLASPIFVGLNFWVFYLLFSSSKRYLMFFYFGVFISVVIYLQITDFKDLWGENYRFGYNRLFSTLAIILSFLPFFRNRLLGLVGINILLGGIVLLSGGRSPAIIYFFSSAILLYAWYLQKWQLPFRFLSAQSMRLGVVLIFTALSMQTLYLWAVEQELFSESYQKKYEEQLARGLPVIFSGRVEIYASLKAIQDAPGLGHGSWASNYKYRKIPFEISGEKIDSERDYYDVHTGRIPTHSFYGQAWVEHGLLGAVFMFFFLFTLINVLGRFFNNPGHFFLYAYSMLFSAYLWDFFFSPFGTSRRVYLGLFLALYCTFAYTTNKR